MKRSLLAAVLLLTLAALAVAYLNPAHAAPVVGTINVSHPCVRIADLEAETHSTAVVLGKNGPETLLAFRSQDGTTTLAVVVGDGIACVVWSSEPAGMGA